MVGLYVGPPYGVVLGSGAAYAAFTCLINFLVGRELAFREIDWRSKQ